jgi:hypothetical protein
VSLAMIMYSTQLFDSDIFYLVKKVIIKSEIQGFTVQVRWKDFDTC